MVRSLLPNMGKLSLFNRNSHIGALPAEVLQIIFLHYAHDAEPYLHVQQTDHSFYSSRAHEIVNPIVLGSVSRRWRRLSRKLPSLWAKLYMVYPTMKQVRLAKLWLTLAAGSPLTLVVSAEDERDAVVMNHLLDLFLSYYDYWHIIDFRLSPQLYSLLTRIPDHSPPMLSSVHVEASKFFPPFVLEQRQPIDTLHSSTTIRRVDWSSSCYSLSQALRRFQNWTYLVELVCSQNPVDNCNLPTIADCLHVLVSCPSLGSLKIVIYPSQDFLPPINAQSPICHSGLQILDISTSAKLSTPLFKSLILPKLETLVVRHFFESFSGNPFLTDARPILDLLERSSCRLQDFSLGTSCVSEIVLLDIISAPQLHSIRKLALSGIKTEQTINLLTRKPDDLQSLAILPLLERLVFLNDPPYSTLDVNVVLLKQMISSRVRPLRTDIITLPLSCLRHINLDLREIDFWDYRTLLKLQRPNLTIIPIRGDLAPRFRDCIQSLLGSMCFEIRE